MSVKLIEVVLLIVQRIQKIVHLNFMLNVPEESIYIWILEVNVRLNIKILTKYIVLIIILYKLKRILKKMTIILEIEWWNLVKY